MKFEEDVEEGGNRWSKPLVATLSLHSLFELRSLLLNGTVGIFTFNNLQNWQTTYRKQLMVDLQVSLDMAASSLEEIADLTLDNMINCGSLSTDKKDQVKKTDKAKIEFRSNRFSFR